MGYQMSLFDEEEFLPKKPAPKTKKAQKETNAATEEEPAAEEPVVQETTEQTPKVEEVKEPEEEIIPTVNVVKPTSSFIALEMPEPVVDEEPEADVVEEKPAINIEMPSVEEAEKELEQTLHQEAIASDYFRYIQRDYPFKIEEAAVITNEEEVPEDEQQNDEIISETELPEEFDEVIDTEDELAVAEEEDGGSPYFDETHVNPNYTPTDDLEDWNLTKLYYTIGEVAAMFKVNTSHIRFWTKEFKFKLRTNKKGDRLYRPEDIKQLRLIHYLVKVKHYTIKGAKEQLKQMGAKPVKAELEVAESLNALKDLLLHIKEQLPEDEKNAE